MFVQGYTLYCDSCSHYLGRTSYIVRVETYLAATTSMYQYVAPCTGTMYKQVAPWYIVQGSSYIQVGTDVHRIPVHRHCKGIDYYRSTVQRSLAAQDYRLLYPVQHHTVRACVCVCTMYIQVRRYAYIYLRGSYSMVAASCYIVVLCTMCSSTSYKVLVLCT